MTGGVNRFPPVGLMLFSVGAGAGAAGDVALDVVVVVVVVVSGAFFSSLAQAVSAPITMKAVTPEMAAIRRPR